MALRHCGTVAATDMSGAEGEAEGEAATSELHNEGHLGATVGSDNACHIYTDTATALLHATSLKKASQIQNFKPWYAGMLEEAETLDLLMISSIWLLRKLLFRVVHTSWYFRSTNTRCEIMQWFQFPQRSVIQTCLAWKLPLN